MGHARNIRVITGLGMGLDEKAIEAVERWKFKPGMKGGVGVNVGVQGRKPNIRSLAASAGPGGYLPPSGSPFSIISSWVELAHTVLKLQIFELPQKSELLQMAA
jgi:hypothetical protein